MATDRVGTFGGAMDPEGQAAAYVFGEERTHQAEKLRLSASTIGKEEALKMAKIEVAAGEAGVSTKTIEAIAKRIRLAASPLTEAMANRQVEAAMVSLNLSDGRFRT